jgi:hypothetical protein
MAVDGFNSGCAILSATLAKGFSSLGPNPIYCGRFLPPADFLFVATQALILHPPVFFCSAHLGSRIDDSNHRLILFRIKGSRIVAPETSNKAGGLTSESNHPMGWA